MKKETLEWEEFEDKFGFVDDKNNWVIAPQYDDVKVQAEFSGEFDFDMKPDQLLRAILPEVLIDNFDIEGFEKSDTRFDIWLDEKKEQLREDKYNKNIISYGFGDYRTIQDYPIRGRATYLHVRKRKWLDKATGEVFSYDWDVSEFDGTRLNAEFVAFLKEGD